MAHIVVTQHHSFTCTPTCLSWNGMNCTCLCLPSRSYYSDLGGMEIKESALAWPIEYWTVFAIMWFKYIDYFSCFVWLVELHLLLLLCSDANDVCCQSCSFASNDVVCEFAQDAACLKEARCRSVCIAWLRHCHFSSAFWLSSVHLFGNRLKACE